MIYGFKHRGQFDLPVWAEQLANLYWCIRVESKNAAKRRRYYRYISKEKLRLAEIGIDQTLINAACKYLVNLSQIRGIRLSHLQNSQPIQLSFDFKIGS